MHAECAETKFLQKPVGNEPLPSDHKQDVQAKRSDGISVPIFLERIGVGGVKRDLTVREGSAKIKIPRHFLAFSQVW